MQAQAIAPPLWLAYTTLGFGIVNLLAVAASLTLAYRQIKKSHEWNRRKASQDLITQLVTGDVRELRHRLERTFGVNIYDKQQTYASSLASIAHDDERAELRHTARTLLNYFEGIAIGIKNKVLEEDICFDFTADVIIAYWRWAAPMVRESQSIRPLTWIELEHMATRWSDRLEEILQRQKEGARIPGRPPT